MTDAAEAEREDHGPLGAWRRSPDLRFYLTATVIALDVVLLVTALRAREEPEIPPERPRATAHIYNDGAPRDALHPAPTRPDPRSTPLSLDEALDGVPGAGAPRATITTSRGTVRCSLDVARAPRGVAIFVGLARGRRPYWDGVRGEWSRAPFYDGSVMFRVRAGVLLEGGGPTRSDAVRVGFEVPVERGAPHDQAGLLSLTARGTLQLTAAPDSTLDAQDAIIGQCEPIALIDLMSDVRVQGERPAVPFFIRSVRITRGG